MGAIETNRKSRLESRKQMLQENEWLCHTLGGIKYICERSISKGNSNVLAGGSIAGALTVVQS